MCNLVKLGIISAVTEKRDGVKFVILKSDKEVKDPLFSDNTDSNLSTLRWSTVFVANKGQSRRAVVRRRLIRDILDKQRLYHLLHVVLILKYSRIPKKERMMSKQSSFKARIEGNA